MALSIASIAHSHLLRPFNYARMYSSVRKPRLNKAAGAADATLALLSGIDAKRDKVRVARRSCDPFAKKDAGGTPAS